MFGRKNQFLLYTVIMIFLVGSLVSVFSCKEKKSWENPYEYKLDEFLKVDEELIWYKETGTIPLPFISPLGIAVDTDGTIYVTGDEKLISLQEDGAIMDQLELGGIAYSCAASSPGIVYLGYADYVEEINLVTKQRTEWASLGEKALITSIAVGNKYVFVANAGNHSVLCYSKDGTLLNRITGKKNNSESHFIIPSPYFDIAAGPDDTFWIVNPGRHRVEHWSVDGEFLDTWGSAGGEPEKFCGCCNPVHITLLPLDGPGSLQNVLFITAEKGLPRIKMYTYTGEFMCIVAPPELFKTGTSGLDLAANTNHAANANLAADANPATNTASDIGLYGKIYVLDPIKKLVRIFERKGK